MRIPPHYLDAVGVLEIKEIKGNEVEFLPVATGTLMSYETKDQSGIPDGMTKRAVFLVTNKHVIEEVDELWIRFNQGSGSERYKVSIRDEEGSSLFTVSEQFDIAVTGVQTDALREAGAEFSSIPEMAMLDLKGMEEKGIVGGDSVFTIGFPMGLAGIERKYAIVRGGVIARVDREIVETTGSYLIDCAVFPGNSGGPVILPTEIHTLGKDDQPRKRVHLIGIVSGYRVWTDVAVSQQSGQPRITFMENSGLATVVPLDAVHELTGPLMDEVEAAESETTKDEDTQTEDPLPPPE